jgi:hypothetical protein
MPRLGLYDHLNDSDPSDIPCTMPALVHRVRGMNYGTHRFLSELVRQREASVEEERSPEHRAHTALLRALLDEKGFY